MTFKNAFLTILISSSLLAAEIHPPAEEALAGITEARFRSHVRFLGDDLLEGRGAGTRGYDLSAAWLAARFEELELEPAGDEGSWFQQVPFVRSTLESGAMILHERSGDRELTLYDDFVVQPDPARATSEVTAPAVFAGFGISAPDLEWDDYARIDVRGKVAVILASAPGQFPPTLRAHHASSANKISLAAERGAVAVVIVRGPESEKRYPWDRMTRGAKLPAFRWVGPDGEIARYHPQLEAVATVSHDTATSLFSRSRGGVERVFALEQNARRPITFPLDARLTIRTTSSHERITSPNVAAIIHGSDPALREEIIVYSAHLDHIGITEPVNGDRINNGVMDNATGIAALVETARAFASLPAPPPRSILFLAVTAEEKGLLGSDYFANHPTVPAERIVANINMDMFLMLYPLSEVLVHGYEHSTLARAVDAAAAQMGIRVIPDPAPEEASFVRSDQYSFVKRGIPGIAISEGTNPVAADPRAASSEWLLTRYHTPADDLDQPIHWEAGRDFARFSFLVGYGVATAVERPRWNEGDFFGVRYGTAR
ncbi:MAG: M28 family metallopeptidase [Thermoanaerobaculia bacterium]